MITDHNLSLHQDSDHSSGFRSSIRIRIGHWSDEKSDASHTQMRDSCVASCGGSAMRLGITDTAFSVVPRPCEHLFKSEIFNLKSSVIRVAASNSVSHSCCRLHITGSHLRRCEQFGFPLSEMLELRRVPTCVAASNSVSILKLLSLLLSVPTCVAASKSVSTVVTHRCGPLVPTCVAASKSVSIEGLRQDYYMVPTCVAASKSVSAQVFTCCVRFRRNIFSVKHL